MAAQLLPGNLEQNRADSLGSRTGQEIGRAVFERHRNGLRSRRERDLIAEKLLLHIDGSGDNQWADIYHGQRVAIPPDISEYRVSRNLLRPIVANFVAYHTTMPWRFIAEAKQTREAQEQAVIDAAIANHIARTQRANQLSGAAMFLASAYGFCPLHAFWRDDLGYDPYEPLYLHDEQEQGLYMPRKGIIDLWVGNPADTTYNPGAKRGSVQQKRYGRVVPAEMVRARYGLDIEGTDKLPSASMFQRIARSWKDITGLNVHGSPVLTGGRGGGEELIALVCEETAPGIDPDYPDGRLTIVALPGAAETNKESSTKVEVIHDGALPGGRFSDVPFYSDQRFDDIHGAPWSEPIDDLQVQYNLTLSAEKELIRKAINAPIFVNGEINEDELDFNGYTVVQALGAGGVSMRAMETPSALFQALRNIAQNIREEMFTIGGYQAASRGESNAGDPFAKVALLAQQDDTIHGPANQAYRDSAADLAQLWWSLFKEYGDVGWTVEAVGDEFETLPEEYIDRTMVSESAPAYRLVSGYGATPEIKGRQLMQLVQIQGADGKPFLPTDLAQKQWPDGSLFEGRTEPGEQARKRARHVSAQLRRMAKQFRQQSGYDEQQIPPQWQAQALQQAAQAVFMQAEQQFRRRQSDDLQANIEALAELIQDETEDPIARDAAELRQQQYFAWQQEIMAQQMAFGAPMGAPGGPPQGRGGPSSVEPDMMMDPAGREAELMGGANPNNPLSAA